MNSEVVYEPHDHDVKGGKGHGSNMHPGNRFYQAKVKEMKPLYAKTESNFEKSLIATEIVNSVQQRDPPGRFLEQTGKNQPWVVLPHDKIMKKVKQALRDKPIPSKEKAGGAQTGTSKSNLPTQASQKPTHSTEATVPGMQSSCPKEDTTMPPMPPLRTENDILGSLGNDIQTETIRSSMANSLRTSQLFAIPPEHTSPQEYRHISVDQIDMNGNIPSNNIHRNNPFYASEGQVQYNNDSALPAYTSSNNSAIPSEHSQLRHSLPQDQPNYQNSEAPFRHSMPAQYEIGRDQSDQIDPRGHEEMHMSLSPFASADLNGIVNMLQDEMGNQSNSDANEPNSGAAVVHPQNSVLGQQSTNVSSQVVNPSVMNYNDISLEDDFNKSDLNKIIDCLQEESPQKRRNMSVQDQVPYQQALYDQPELPVQSNHRRPTLLNFQVQRNSSTQVVQEEFKEPNPITNHNQFTGLPSPSHLDSTDDASITLDDLQGEAPKNSMSQSVPNYVSSSNTTQKYPHALDLRHSHNSHNRPLHTSTIQIKPDEGNETMANTSMAFSDSSLSVGDLLAKDGSSPGCPNDVAQGHENEEEPLQSNNIQNQGALSDGGKDATMDFDNTKNTDFWGSVMSQMEFSFQNVMNFVSGKDGKGDRE